MKIISIDYDTTVCPNCGNKIERPGDDVLNATCFFSESCDDGGGCTGYLVICHNDKDDK